MTMRQGLKWGLVGLGALLALLLVAALLSLSLVPKLVRSLAGDWTRDKLGLELAMGEVRFNPLELTLDMSDIALPAQKPMASARHVHLDFALASLFSDALRFDAVRIEAPRVEAVLDAQGRLNLARLVPPPSPDPSPALLIRRLDLDAGVLAFTDQSRGSPRAARLIPVAFRLDDLHTQRDAGGRFTLSGATEKGETLDWKGRLSLAPMASAGTVALSGLKGARIGPYLADVLPSRLEGGDLDLVLGYDARLQGDRLVLDVAVPRLTVRALTLALRPETFRGLAQTQGAAAIDARLRLEAGGEAPMSWALRVPGMAMRGVAVEGTGAASGEGATLAQAAVSDLAISSADPVIRVQRLDLDGLKLSTERRRDGALGLLRLLPPAPAGAAAAAAPPPIEIARLRLRGAEIGVAENSTPRGARYTLKPLDAELSGLRSDGAGPIAVRASGRLNGRPVAVSGSVSPAAGSADVQLSLDRLPLALLLPYVPDFPALQLMSGTVSVKGRARASMRAKGPPDARFDGNVEVAGFALRELVRNGNLFAFRTLRLQDVRYGGGALEIADGLLVAPQGQVALLPDGAFNYGFLLDEDTSVAEARTMLASPTPAAPAARKPSRAEQRAEAARAAEARRALAAEQRARARARASESATMPVTLRRLRLRDGTLGFADLSIDPSFEARIEGLSGQIDMISTRPGSVSRIALNGYVIDRYAPVSIAGTMNLFDYAANTAVRMEFRNIDLPVFNPYSGRYAGYAIAKGKLAATLDYKVVESALAANHHVVIDQMEWGEATESKEKVPIPIRFATSFLKDRNGVITIDLPVTGTVDDPQFSIWPVVWKHLGQFMGKIISAPFRALGGLFAGKEDAEFIAFAPGSATLPADAPETLAELARALGERPALRLDIPGGPGIAPDAKALAREALDAALAGKQAKGATGAAAAAIGRAVPPETREDRLKDLYEAKLGKDPDFGKSPEGETDAARTARRISMMEEALLPLFSPAPDQLAALGKARAEAVRAAVLTGTEVDPARVFLDLNDAFQEKGDAVAMKLRLE